VRKDPSTHRPRGIGASRLVSEIPLPGDADAVLGVFVDGVAQVEGRDYDVEAGRVRLRQPLRLAGDLTRLGALMTALCAGVYPQGHDVAVLVSRSGTPQLIAA